jgi:hypothetical protein
MSIAYLTSIFLLFLISWLHYRKKLSKHLSSIRWMYYMAYSLSIILYLCIVLQINIPMPTQFFLNHVSPWVFAFLNR